MTQLPSFRQHLGTWSREAEEETAGNGDGNGGPMTSELQRSFERRREELVNEFFEYVLSEINTVGR